jgi:SAM-dependent methyltransferase
VKLLQNTVDLCRTRAHHFGARGKTVRDRRKPQDVLKDLINEALADRHWDYEDAARVAKEKGLGRGFSLNNLRAYAEGGRVRNPKPPLIRAFESLFGVPENDWARRIFRRELDHALLREKKLVIGEQQQLSRGDEVWIISCRRFLEAQDADIGNLVCDALRKGVIYNYFFPSKSGPHPYGDEARQSYESFRQKLRKKPLFKETPQIFGFALEPQQFSYFSKLHTIVRYKRLNGPSTTYCYIEIGKDKEEGVHGTWYPLPDSVWPQIENELADALCSIADSQLEETSPTNPNLQSIKLQYISWFNNVVNADHYSSLRGLIAQSADHSVNNIIQNILQAEIFGRQKKEIRYLDIGCGDGRMTLAITHALQDAVAEIPVSVVALDPSSAQMTLATESLRAILNASFMTTLEEFVKDQPTEQFDIVTAIHSLYTVDDAFLPRIVDLLSPGGIACIWMGALTENVINSLADESDKIFRPFQRRNYAEEIERILKRSTLNQVASTIHAYNLVLSSDPMIAANEDNAIIRFCSLQQGAADQRLRSAWTNIRQRNPKLPITDYLITIRRPTSAHRFVSTGLSRQAK